MYGHEDRPSAGRRPDHRPDRETGEPGAPVRGSMVVVQHLQIIIC
jgi:hypothetical protein